MFYRLEVFMLSNKSLKLVGLVFGFMLVAGCQQTPTTSAAAKMQRPPVVSQQPAQQRQAQAEQTIITVHLAQRQSESELITVNLGGDNKLYALPQPILTHADMQQITPITAQDSSTYIMFEMNQQGRAKLANVSSRAKGHYLLISAKDQLISVAQIAEPITDGKLLISTSGAQHTQQMLQLLR